MQQRRVHTQRERRADARNARTQGRSQRRKPQGRHARSDDMRARRTLAPARRKQARRPARKSAHARPMPPARTRLPLAAVIASAALVAVSMLLLVPATEGVVPEATIAVSQGEGGVSTRVANVDELFTSPYDWGNLYVDERGRYAYMHGGQRMSRTGIDVSEHQQDIDWQSVADDGIDFAIIRVGFRGASSGTLTKDIAFDYNLRAAHEAGLDVGVYFYSLATTAEEAREEAAFTLEALDGAALEYPVVFDIEPTTEGSDRLGGLDKDKMTAIAQAFCERIEEAGYHASIYGNQTDLSRYHLMQLAQYGFWYAQYGSEPTMSLRFALWQYSQQGEVEGIEHAVDLDLDLTQVLNAAEEGPPT